MKLFKSIDQLKWLKPRRYCHLLMNAELRVQFVYSLLRTALPCKNCIYTLPILHCDQTVLWSMSKLAPKIDVISLSLLLKEFNFNFKMTRCFISQHAHTCICVCCLTLWETVFPEWWWNFGESVNSLNTGSSICYQSSAESMWRKCDFLDPIVFCNDFI